MFKVIITGGPHTGKTTLLDALKAKHPDFTYVPEPATLVIEAEHQRERSEEGYEGTFPWNNYAGFGPKVIAKSLELEKRLNSDGLIILDRSLIDTVAYARLNDCEHLLSELYKHIEEAQYKIAFLCDFVGSYQRSHIRSESPEEAQIIQKAIKIAYRESGIEVIDMPAMSLDERIALFENTLNLHV